MIYSYQNLEVYISICTCTVTCSILFDTWTVQFTGTQLSKVHNWTVQFTGTQLSKSHNWTVQFTGTQLSKVHNWTVQFTGTQLSKGHNWTVQFTGTQLSKGHNWTVQFTGTQLSKVHNWTVQFTGTQLSKVHRRNSEHHSRLKQWTEGHRWCQKTISKFWTIVINLSKNTTFYTIHSTVTLQPTVHRSDLLTTFQKTVELLIVNRIT